MTPYAFGGFWWPSDCRFTKFTTVPYAIRQVYKPKDCRRSCLETVARSCATHRYIACCYESVVRCTQCNGEGGRMKQRG